MRRLRVVLALAAVMVVGSVLPASAGNGAYTETVHYDTVEIAAGEALCLDTFATADVNGVEHVTANKNGFHFTFTETGSLSGYTEPNEMGEALEGHYTLWVGGNFDAEGAGMGVVTLSFHGTADGDPVSFNWLEKFWEDGMGGVHIEGKVNCHDGQGVSRYEMDF